MELQKGICSLCHNNKVITSSWTETASNVICSLFSKKTINIEELNKIQSLLKFCPICYHKLILLKGTSEKIQDEEAASNKCVLCKGGQVLFKINNWLDFNKISEDLVSREKDACYIACSDCIFFLNTRYEIKSKLISKYPRLRLKPTRGNENRKKSKDILNVSSHSTMVSESKEMRSPIKKIRFSRNSDGSQREDTFNVNFVNKLKPLKDCETFGRQEVIKSDFKLLNQVPCALLLPLSNGHNDKNALNRTNDKKVSSKMAQMGETDKKNCNLKSAGPKTSKTRPTLNKPIKHRRLQPKLIKATTEMSKGYIVKDLIVKLPKMNISQKHKTKSRNYKHDPEIENLIDKFNVLQRPTTARDDSIVEENSEDDIIDLTKDAVKTKRKSVSFAEDKNVEIKFGQDNFKNSVDDDPFDRLTKNSVKAKKLNRNRRQSEFVNETYVAEKDVQVETQNIESIEQSEADEKCISSEDIANSDVKTKLTEAGENIRKKANTSEEHESNTVEDEEMVSNSDKGGDSEESTKRRESEAEKEGGIIKVKQQRKRRKPGPLSRKNDGSNSNISKNMSLGSIEDEIVDRDKQMAGSAHKIFTDDEAADSEESGKSRDSEAEKESGIIENKQQPKRGGRPGPLSKKKRGNKTNKSSKSVGSESDKEDKSKNDDESVVGDEQMATSGNDAATNNKSEVGEELAESLDVDQNVQEHEETEAEEGVEEIDVEKKPKRQKPKPLSKKKKDNSDDKSSENLDSEIDSETMSPKSLSRKEESDGTDIVTDNSDQIVTKCNEDCASNEPEQIYKKTELDSNTVTDKNDDNVDNSVTNDGNQACEETERDITDKSKTDDEGKPVSQINNENSTNDTLDFDAAKGKEGSSEGTLLDEEKENECSSRKKDADDGSMVENKSVTLETSEETVQLDILHKENVKCTIGESAIDPNLNGGSKGSEKDPTGGDKANDSKEMKDFDSNSFSDSDKNDDDDDARNINSILTNMFSPDEQCGVDGSSEWKIIEKDTDDSKTNNKRKIVDELNNSSDKKKKRVTFCEGST